MKNKLLLLLVIALCLCNQSMMAQTTTCLPPSKVIAQCLASDPSSMEVIIMEQTGESLASQYRISRTNLATGQVSNNVVQTAGATGNTFNTVLTGLAPATDYLIRVRRICSTNPLEESPPTAAISSCPDSYAAIVNVERKASGVTTVKELGPLYICNLDSVKSTTVQIKNDSTGVTVVAGYSLAPGECICWGNSKTLYKITITAGVNFKISATRTRVSCPSASNKTGDSGDDATPWTLYPNPTQGAVALEYTAQHNEQLSVMLYSADGRLVDQLLPNTIHEAGTWLLNWDMGELPNGVYYCHIQGNQGAKVLKLLKIDY